MKDERGEEMEQQGVLKKRRIHIFRKARIGMGKNGGNLKC